MTNKIILRLANGLGNQLFLFSTAYAFAKKLNYKLEIDKTSGFRKDNRNIKSELHNFSISATQTDNNNKFNNGIKNLKRNLLKKKDYFFKKKSFIIEKRDEYKNTFFSNHYLKEEYNKIIYMEGYFQSEKYFIEYKKDILEELRFNNYINCLKLKFKKEIISNNSVAIHLRQHTFSETNKKKMNYKNLNLSEEYIAKSINHIKKSVKFFEKKIQNPLFFVFSNDFQNIEKNFSEDKYVLVNDNAKDPIYDFYLMHLCKHFIVSPSTYSWWAAWLSKNQNKICIKPPAELIYSNNKDINSEQYIDIYLDK